MKSFGRISITRMLNGSDGITVNFANDTISIPVDGNLHILDSTVKRIGYVVFQGATDITSKCTVELETAMEPNQIDFYDSHANKQIIVTPTTGGLLTWRSKDFVFKITVPGMDSVIRKTITVNAVLSSELSVGSTNLIRNSAKFSTHPTTNVRCTVTKAVIDEPGMVSGKAMAFTLNDISATGTNDVGFEISDLFSSTEYIGNVYTLGFYIKTSRNMTITNFGFNSGGLISNVACTTEWQKVTNTWTYTGTGATKFIVTTPNNFQDGDVIYISDFKVESGYFAGDWSPHPLDVEDNLNELFSTTELIQLGYRDIHAAINGDPESLNPGLIADLESLRDKNGRIDRYIKDYFEENGIIDQIKENLATLTGGQEGLRGEVAQLTIKYNDDNESLLDIFRRTSAVAQTATDWIASFEENGMSIGSISFNPRTGLTVMTDSGIDENAQNYRTIISSNQFVCQLWDPNTQGYTKEVFSLSEDLFITKRLSVSNGIDLGILKFVNTQDNGVQGIDVVLGEGVDD